MNTPSRDAYVVDLRTNPGAFRVILGETSTGYSQRWTLWGRDEAALRHLRDFGRDLGFSPRAGTDRTLDTTGRPDYSRMTTLANEIARMGGIVLINCPFADDPVQVAAHLEMMQRRHGWLRVGHLDGRRVAVLESSRIEGGFHVGERVRERGGFELTGRIIRLGVLDGAGDDPVRVQSYVVELDSGGTIEFPATHIERDRAEVTA